MASLCICLGLLIDWYVDSLKYLRTCLDVRPQRFKSSRVKNSGFKDNSSIE